VKRKMLLEAARNLDECVRTI